MLDVGRMTSPTEELVQESEDGLSMLLPKGHMVAPNPTPPPRDRRPPCLSEGHIP